MRATYLFCVMLLAGAVAGCSAERIVNTGEPPAATPATSASTPPLPPPSAAHLVNAFDYVAHLDGDAVYFFTTPSGRWACAIVPRVKAGCQSAAGWQSAMGIRGAPDSVPDSAGEASTPNAVVVGREADAGFVALEEPEFRYASAKELDFNRVLAAAGFRCNVQETGVSCLSELSRKGFTFSAEGFAPHYTEVPAGAP
ncbi:hypothetical protein [Mycolicibacterium sp. XJ1819]